MPAYELDFQFLLNRFQAYKSINQDTLLQNSRIKFQLCNAAVLKHPYLGPIWTSGSD